MTRSKMASSKGKEVDEVHWLNKNEVAYLEPDSAQTKNPRITCIATNDSRNKQGYNFLIFSPPHKKKPYPVVFYHGLWWHLEYNRDEDNVYLGSQFPSVHEYNPKEKESRPDSPDSIQETDNLD